ncbi:MAG TPA: hypothetical protein VG965_03305 [Patescibacteria group bacterium]|nr:hypothetical protein [Patescibacteria group bacterium]
MLKREKKRKIRWTVNLAILIIAALVAILFLYKIQSFVFSFLKFGIDNSNGNIVKPVTQGSTLDDIKGLLSDKNIILDSINVSSDSATYIGVIHDGPTVYFSQDQDPKWQVDSLYLILSRMGVDNKKPQYIDLRSIRPIVKF